MVGSIATTVQEGQTIQRADELGYFAFGEPLYRPPTRAQLTPDPGGSTIVCVFEKGALRWDDDLLDNGRASMETLVRMGTGIGRSTKAVAA